MNLRSALMALSLAEALPAFGAPNPDRDAYFGETHIHTSWSVDAWVMGNRITGPDEAYKYAQRPGNQASARLRYQDRDAVRIHGGDRPLGVRGHHQAGQHSGLLREHAARSAALIMKDPNDPATLEDVGPLIVRSVTLELPKH